MIRPLVIAVTGLVATLAYADRAPYDTAADYIGVPRDIFYAMALAESGRVRNGQFAPWPWTLNIAGEAHFYTHRDAMFAALMAALQHNSRRVDVGPLQLNWHWQFAQIDSPWRLTDPVVNAKLAAAFLKERYALSGDWWIAVGHYHRPRETTDEDRATAAAYRERVRALHARHSSSNGEAAAGEMADAY
tara:strand:+ start:5131 stop:5697 length:567 start_codon:yes stop_codon:yes gene_type:complete